MFFSVRVLIGFVSYTIMICSYILVLLLSQHDFRGFTTRTVSLTEFFSLPFSLTGTAISVPAVV